MGMQSFDMITRPSRETEIIQISGAVDANNFPALGSLLTNLVKSCQFHGTLPQIILDCRSISYIGGVELQELLDLARFARTHGGDIKCASLASTIEQVMNLTCHGDSLDCHQTIRSALDAFHTSPMAA